VEVEPGDGRPQWMVVGGSTSGGIVVRAAAEVVSPELRLRLSTGALVEELEPPQNGRLHFRKLRGEGPDFGWASLNFRGVPLLLCVSKEEQ